MSQATEKTVKVDDLIEIEPEVVPESSNDPLAVFRGSWSLPPFTPEGRDETNRQSK